MSQDLARAHQDRSMSREKTFAERAAQRTYSHEDYEITARDETSRESSPCYACQIEGQHHSESHEQEDSQFDMKPVKQSSWSNHQFSKKQLEATQTYTMINKEHLTTLEDRMSKEQEQKPKVLVHENYEPVSNPVPV